MELELEVLALILVPSVLSLSPLDAPQNDRVSTPRFRLIEDAAECTATGIHASWLPLT